MCKGVQLKNDYIPEACVFDRPPQFFKEERKTFWAHIQSLTLTRNRLLGLSSLFVSFEKRMNLSSYTLAALSLNTRTQANRFNIVRVLTDTFFFTIILEMCCGSFHTRNNRMSVFYAADVQRIK